VAETMFRELLESILSETADSPTYSIGQPHGLRKHKACMRTKTEQEGMLRHKHTISGSRDPGLFPTKAGILGKIFHGGSQGMLLIWHLDIAVFLEVVDIAAFVCFQVHGWRGKTLSLVSNVVVIVPIGLLLIIRWRIFGDGWRARLA
jgi:hypothetical protein